jgi:hypothetical protein
MFCKIEQMSRMMNPLMAHEKLVSCSPAKLLRRSRLIGSMQSKGNCGNLLWRICRASLSKSCKEMLWSLSEPNSCEFARKRENMPMILYKSLIILTLWRAKSDSRSQFLFNLPILRREPSNEPRSRLSRSNLRFAPVPPPIPARIHSVMIHLV